MNVVVLGPFNAGKSTILGHLCCECGVVDKQQLAQIETQAVKKANLDYKYAFIMDKSIENRRSLRTSKISFTNIKTDRFNFLISDTPGHSESYKTTILAIAQSDVAIFVVDSTLPVFEEDSIDIFNKGSYAFALGINHIIFAVNKIDEPCVLFSEDRFCNIKKNLIDVFIGIGFKQEQLEFVPVSGLQGDNLVSKSPHIPWWTGKTLMEALNSLEPPKRYPEMPLRIPVHQVYRDNILAGCVEFGVLKENMSVVVPSPGLIAKVKSIQFDHGPLSVAHSGANVGIRALGFSRVSVGSVIGDPNNCPPRRCKSFKALLHITYCKVSIRCGYTALLCVHTAQVPVGLIGS